MPFNERGDLAVVGAEDQVAFPVTGHRPVFNRGWTFTDGDGIRDSVPSMVVSHICMHTTCSVIIYDCVITVPVYRYRISSRKLRQNEFSGISLPCFRHSSHISVVLQRSHTRRCFSIVSGLALRRYLERLMPAWSSILPMRSALILSITSLRQRRLWLQQQTTPTSIIMKTEPNTRINIMSCE